MKKKFLSILLAVSMLLMALPTSSSAYVLIGGRIAIVGNMIPSANFTSATITHMGQMFNLWNNAAGKTLMTISSSRHYDDDTSANYRSHAAMYDKQHKTYREERGEYSAVGQMYGTRVTDFWLGTKIESADILINMQYSFANSAQPNRYDTATVFLHEAGHALGLGESNLQSFQSIMHQQMFMNVERRYLYQDDINAIKAKNY